MQGGNTVLLNTGRKVREKWRGALGDTVFTVISWLVINLNPGKLFVKFKFLSWLRMGFHSSKLFSSIKCIT